MASGITVPLNVTLNPASLNAASKQMQQSLGRITGQASEFQKSLDASTARVFAFGATTAVLNGVSQAFKALVTTTVEVEATLTELKTILGGTTSEFNAFRDTIFSVAKNTGQSFNVVADAAGELARQGLSAEETAKRLESALILTRISGLDSVKSVKALTAAINGFTSAGLTAEQITNKLVAVDTAFAVSAQDLAEAFSRAGSTAEDAGVSFDQLLGIITAVEQRTGRGGAVIGNALKSIFSRLGRGQVIDDLRELGVQISANQTGIQKLQALSSAIEKVGDPTVVQKIKELAGGVYQINVVSAALKDLGSDTSIFAQAAATASSATNEAFQKNAALNETIRAQMNSLVVGLTDLAEKIGQITFAPLAKNLLGLANRFTEFLNKALDPEAGNTFIKGLFATIGNFLAGPGLILFTTAFIKIFTVVAKFAKDGLQSVLEIGSKSEKIKSVEAGIVELLSRDQNLRQVIASTTATQAQKQQAVIAAIQQENALLEQQAALLRNIAAATVKAGVSGYSPSGGFSGKGGKKFATGFQQEEATAMMLGASPSVKAHYGKGTIGGQRFIMNNQETEIPNFGENGDSAVIPKYAKGFVPNFAKIATETSKTNLKSIIANKSGRRSMADQDAAKKRLAELEKKQIQEQEEKIQLDAALYGYLIPTLNDKKIFNNISGIIKKGNARIPYTMSNVNIHGPSVPMGPKVLTNKSKKDEQIGENIRQSIYKNAAAFANTIQPIGGKVDSSQVADKMNNLGGAKGAIQSAIGSAFEGAVATALNISPLKNIEGGDFDIKNQTPEINDKVRTLFGIANSGISIMDFKVSYSKSNLDSFAKKIYNQQALSPSPVVKKNKVSRKAYGYIPNFNSMNEGVPISKIRAHFDENGNPVAVTNTRDEPNGLKDAISREKKGIGTYSSGFIPNFIKLPKIKMPKGLIKKTVESLPEGEGEGGDGSSGSDKKKDGAAGMDSGKAIMKSMGVSAAASALQSFAESLKNQEAPLASLGINASAAAEEATKATAGLVGSATQFASMGASFGVWGAIIGAGVGIVKGVYDEWQASAERIRQADEQSKVLDEKLANLKKARAINEQLGIKKMAEQMNKFKKAGIDTSGITSSKQALQDAATDSQREEAAKKYKEEMQAAMEAYAKKLRDMAEDDRLNKATAEFARSLASLNESIKGVKGKLDKMAEDSDIMDQLKISKFDSPMAEATKTANVGFRKTVDVQQKQANFTDLLSGNNFTSLLKKQVLAAGEGKNISKEAYDAFKNKGEAGVDSVLSKYLDKSKEGYKEFRDSIIASAGEIKTATTSGAVFFQNAIQDSADNIRQSSEDFAKAKAENNAKMNELLNTMPSRLREALNGPQADVEAIKSAYAQASKQNPLEAAKTLAQNKEILDAGTKNLGPEAMASIARSQGFTKAKQEATIQAGNIQSMGGTEAFRQVVKGIFGPNVSPTKVNQQLGKGINTNADITALQKAIEETEKNRGGETKQTKAAKETLEAMKTQAAGEEGDAKKQMDEATKKFITEQNQFTEEMAKLVEQYKTFSAGLMDKEIPEHVKKLKESISKSASNVESFTTLTDGLNKLSTTVSDKIAKIQAKLDQLNQ